MHVSCPTSQELETVGRKVVMLWWCVVFKFTDLERRLSLKQSFPNCVSNRDRTSLLDLQVAKVTSPRLGRRPLKPLLLVGVQMKAIPCPCKLCWKQYLVLENSGELELPCFRHHGICRFHLGKHGDWRGSLLVKNATMKKHWVQEICVSWGFSTFSHSTTFFVFAKDMPWDGFVNIPGGLVKTQWGSRHLDDEYHVNVKCKPWAMNHEHHSVDATRFVAAQWFCVGITCRNYPIMQKHFENHDIIVQKKEIGPGWVNAFIVLTDSNGKMYVWRFLLGKRWPSSMELMQLLWLWKMQPSKTRDASHDLLIK